MNQGETRFVIDTRSVVKTIAILVLAFALFLIRDVILIVLTAVVIAASLEPGIKFCIRHRIHRTIAALLLYIIIAAFFLVALYFLLVPLLAESSTFLTSLPDYTQTIASATSSNAFISSITSTLSIPDLVNQINTTLVHISSGFFGTIDVIFGGALSFVLIIVLSFYLAVQEDGVAKLLKLATPVQDEKYVLSLWKKTQEKIGFWIQGQLLLAVIVAVLAFLGLTLIGVSNALLLAFIVGVLEIIPVFGPIISAVPAIIIAFNNNGFGLAAITAGLFLIIQQFEAHLIYPLVVRKVVGVPPIVSILALLIGAKLAGFLGIILSVPIATAIMVVIEDFERRKIEA
ncbi:MAG: AI-2E family transporter [Minisyncoccia bacterium]